LVGLFYFIWFDVKAILGLTKTSNPIKDVISATLPQ
jgi:hypothetical protein